MFNQPTCLSLPSLRFPKKIPFLPQLNHAQRWGFPSKQNPAHKNPALLARIKELWEKNYTQKEMVDVLTAEGFQINDRELMRARIRFQWYMRDSRPGTRRRGDFVPGMKNGKGKGGNRRKKARIVPGNGLIDRLANAILQGGSSSEEEEGEEEEEEEDESGEEDAQGEETAAASDVARDVAGPVRVGPPEPEALDPDEVLRRELRQLRQQQMQAESDEKWRTRKRRRRTRGWAGLPADAPGEPPRFPSETTIDESKAYLGLDNKLYKQMRDQFQAICEEQGVMKKTVAGPEKWAQLLQRLIRENAHLANVFREESESPQQSDPMWRPKNHKSLSLDVICQDVTKRMRVVDSRMGQPEAKNVLGLNPEQTRQVRSALLAILKADHFTNRYEQGEEHLNALKLRWLQESEHLRHVLAPTGEQPDPQQAAKLKATEVIARDVMKRFRSGKGRVSEPKQAHQGPGPGPAAPSAVTSASTADRSRQKGASGNQPSAQGNANLSTLPTTSDFEIDPSLLLAASDASTFPQQDQHDAVPTTEHQPRIQRQINAYNNTHTHNTSSPYASFPSHTQSSFLPNGPLPIYFRLHPLSDTPLPNKTVWLSVLQTGTLSEVKTLAMREHPGTVVLRVKGLIMHYQQQQQQHSGEAGEREVAVAIDDDAELNAFLGHVQGGKATFVVLLGLSSGGNTAGAFV